MTKRGWFLVSVCSVLVLGLAPRPAPAQQPAQTQTEEAKAEAMQDIQLTRGLIAVERQTIITQAMDLTPEEMQGFWPLYREYRSEAAKVGDRIVALISAYADAYQELSDQVAEKPLTDFVSIEKERARLKAKYLPKFKKVLPARKVARFYQLENKLDITVLHEMAENIPLIR
ncbi:MAG TPA: hypothetical protein VLH58_01240 [Candidatus Methylomirabilis sp.]|nr:hypothetical protein [Candidatus Methylomirabilis sp.]